MTTKPPINLNNNEHYTIKLGDNDIMEIVWNDGASVLDYKDLLEDMFTLSTSLEDQTAPVRVLVDFEKFVKFDVKMEGLGMAALKDVPYDKMAGYNIQPVAKPMIDVMRDALNAMTSGVIKEFDSREDAKKWLLENN